MSDTPELATLRDLCGLRSAPLLLAGARRRLFGELRERIGSCDWFTIGVMAADPDAARAALRACERAFGWQPLAPEPEEVEPTTAAAEAVFLKGNQATGRFRMRPEAGLGTGVLITGHCPDHPELEDTWGPFPLDFFD